MSADDDDVQMYPVRCQALCGRTIGWSDEPAKVLAGPVIICDHCMNHPEEVEARLTAAGA